MAGRFSHLEVRGESRGVHDERPAAENASTRTHSHHGSRGHDAARLLATATVACRDGEHEGALRLYTRALREDRRLVPAWVGQVQMLVQLGEHHEARVWSDKALELFKGNGELLAAKAQACVRLKDTRGAYAASDGALAAAGSSPWRWQVRGELLLAGGKRQHVECFEKALAEPQADWFDRVVIAGICRFYDSALNAVAYLRQALALEPTSALAWSELGRCQVSLGMTGEARTSFERCLSLRPDFRDAVSGLQSLDSSGAGSWLRGLLRRARVC